MGSDKKKQILVVLRDLLKLEGQTLNTKGNFNNMADMQHYSQVQSNCVKSKFHAGAGSKTEQLAH